MGISLVRLRELYERPHIRRLTRYSMVSVISTIVSQGTLFITFGLLRVWSAVPSNVFANAVATVPSYYLNRSWAWGKTGKSHLWREVVPFWGLSFAGMALSMWTVWIASKWSLQHHYTHMAEALFVNGANFFAFGVLWIVKFLLINKMFHVAPVEGDPVGEQLAGVSGMAGMVPEGALGDIPASADS
ncbi:MAG: GtrA family protein [Actinobacteria bacterium]|nr:GtrA family protein [Actinomycetota bacterium]MCL5446464.1 GtrA family protein [Actinomycetota bacterium]